MTSLVFFYLASVIILGGGLTVILSSNIIYAALGLMASRIGVAGIFILSFAPFLRGNIPSLVDIANCDLF